MEIVWSPGGLYRWEHSLASFRGQNMKTMGSTLPPFEAKGMDPSVRGEVFVTRSKWHKFDGTKWDGVTPAK
eukprot:8996329-Prorocentrum_lima.AAC.1